MPRRHWTKLMISWKLLEWKQWWRLHISTVLCIRVGSTRISLNAMNWLLYSVRKMEISFCQHGFHLNGRWRRRLLPFRFQSFKLSKSANLNLIPCFLGWFSFVLRVVSFERQKKRFPVGYRTISCGCSWMIWMKRPRYFWWSCTIHIIIVIFFFFFSLYFLFFVEIRDVGGAIGITHRYLQSLDDVSMSRDSFSFEFSCFEWQIFRIPAVIGVSPAVVKRLG